MTVGSYIVLVLRPFNYKQVRENKSIFQKSRFVWSSNSTYEGPRSGNIKAKTDQKICKITSTESQVLTLKRIHFRVNSYQRQYVS